jgi:hypothetical protein
VHFFKPILLLSLLGFLLGCEKEKHGYFEPEMAVQVLPSCDDTSAFKNVLDLIQLGYLEDCYLCNAIKEVPGLGEIPWKANSRATVSSSNLSLTFETYEPWGEMMVQREEVICGVPASVGLHPINGGFYLRTLSDGDVIGAVWVYDTTCVSFVDVKQLDLECGEARGNFELHFILDDPKGISQPSERVNFLNGKFEARILQY